jgi:hypothetical protein
LWLTSSDFLIKIFLMKKILYFYSTHKKNCYLAAGLVLSCLFMIPYFLLGGGSIVTYHDQLDGELFSYLLTAKYLFTDIRVYPEIMNGLPAAGAVPPAPLFVLLYAAFKPFTAFMISQWIIYLTAFLGMYLLLMRLTGREFISFSIAVIFMLMPFYPVYGLCIPGQPLLFFAVLALFDKERRSAVSSSFPRKAGYYFSADSIFYYLIIFFYGISSSLVLAGFACLLLLGGSALIHTITALRQKKRGLLSLWLSLIVLLASYISVNSGLIRQVLFPGNTYISHKTEMILSPQNFSDYFKEAFTTGISYAQSFHLVLFILMLFCLLLFFINAVVKKESLFSGSDKLPLLKALRVLLFIFLTCLFYAFYHGHFITEIRNISGGILKTFNLDRVCWLLPTAWCILAGYLLSFIAGLREHKTAARSCSLCLKYGIISATLGIWGITVLLHSPLRPNLSKLLKGGDYYALDWDRFFAEDIFSQIDSAIGKPKDSYHVISIGIYPAAAAYNGFYCLDGYSNNYPLEYKHTFRRIMEDELEKSDYIRDFFDNWGNRCYITTAEQANYYTFEKKWNSVIYDLDLNTDVLKELDCRYVFSAAYLMNAEEKGLTLLREAPFEAEGSWYHIYVYAVD